MEGRNYYRGSGGRNNPPKAGRWILLLMCLAVALLMKYGQSAPLQSLRAKAEDFLYCENTYQDAAAAVGKFFSGDGKDESVVSVFNKLFLGDQGGEDAAGD